ncbi:MAG: tRNA pseudouridine(38-40) synthase TruA [Proteobacteria bacterium]|nr:tRNA pseudouridine(38-40) synthase TruA [Pseudomonadota bacterium]MBU1689050.1 tRNA pseudouridine(38-40) synthase TruA [Pseudomonadota bacterium]
MKKNITASKRHRYRLTLEYDGNGFSGWQKQDDARTIQGSLLKAGTEIFHDLNLDIQGHGRTDAGVHALSYTAHLETNTVLPPFEILEKFNELLPAAIVVLDVTGCSPRFHARHNCIGRSYLYQFALRKNAFHKKYVWWIREPLNLEAMADAGRRFTGMHDFASFAEKQELKKSTKVMLNGVFLYNDGEILRLRVVGSHFLWKMVRKMAGVLIEVGRGNLTPDQISEFLNNPLEVPTRFTAPPSGLFFEQAFYDQEELTAFLATATETCL